jgi:hypothetical protein
MPTLRLETHAGLRGPATPAGDSDRERASYETSDERFDRAAFARRALDLVRPVNTTVAICEGTERVALESGPTWGRRAPGERWAMLLVSPHASRRAIALAVAELAQAPRAYALDVLMDGATAPSRSGKHPACPGLDHAPSEPGACRPA